MIAIDLEASHPRTYSVLRRPPLSECQQELSNVPASARLRYSGHDGSAFPGQSLNVAAGIPAAIDTSTTLQRHVDICRRCLVRLAWRELLACHLCATLG